LDFGATTEALMAEQEYATPFAIFQLNPKGSHKICKKFRQQEIFYIV